MSGQTPWQTLGPFFHTALPWKGGADLVGGDAILGARLDLVPDGHDHLGTNRRDAVDGASIEITGTVFDGDGAPVPDALLEIWQADAAGRYDSAFVGFGRAATDADGGYRFRTVRPGRADEQAPHIAIGMMGRGLLRRLVTRLYFAGDPANDADAILALVPPERRDTLMAIEGSGVWRFDIRLQGERETVFLDL